MAFDRPLEADRVDDLNLFSVFLRAPVVGTLMWILGGDQAKQEEEKEKQKMKHLVHGTSDSTLSTTPCSSSGSLGSRKSSLQSLKIKSALKKAPTNLMGSTECSSDIEQCSEALDEMHLSAKPHNPLKRQKKNLSWSDESGKSLVEYVGENVSKSNDSIVDTTETRTGGMSRSRSIRAHADHIKNVQAELEQIKRGEPRYLPRGLDKAHNGIIMPARPYDAAGVYRPPHAPVPVSGADSGEDSPQWGWFMRTTPPTPPMYYSRPPPATYSSSSESSFSSTGSAPRTNPVFAAMQEKNKLASPSMGWSSVPL